eukprot:gnl/MRDRNA2_/MRDRNA2_36233_c0_seq1.p1 gnl/MRDRNA2_/MRDRNA2_36233_c0~~gnl/MRDRNA2_/MRDRNA2_36233_c0_seq1.p1  ORF type:complete len:467 (-),score=55.35 gnl/MRDRNA2_/MRDRNA2_36233_c0_seq1:24-1424(-)
MRNIIASTLVGIVEWASVMASEVSADKMSASHYISHELIGQAPRARPIDATTLDSTTFAKPAGHLSIRSAQHRSVAPGLHSALPARPSSRMAWSSNLHGRRFHLSASVDKGTNILEITNSQGLLVQIAREGYRFIWKRLLTELAPQSKNGTYVRPSYASKGWIGEGPFPIESGRYHIYLGNPCPWCHRVALSRALNGLEDVVSMSYMEDNPVKASRGGWAFGDGAKKDPVFGAKDLREVYDLVTPGGDFKGRCTAPLLIDKKEKKIVSNESKDIVRMLNTVDFPGKSNKISLFPAQLASQIQEMNSWVYEEINNGVYKSGFSTDQAAYEDSVERLFAALDRCEAILTKSKFLNGEFITESDVFLLPTVVRFDAVYNSLFRCSLKKICEYPAIFRWLEDMQRIPGVRKSFDLEDAKRSYFQELFPLNPSRIIARTSANIGLDVKEDPEFASNVLLPSNEQAAKSVPR